MRKVYNVIYVLGVFIALVIAWGWDEDESIMVQWLIGIALIIMTATFTFMNRRQRRE